MVTNIITNITILLSTFSDIYTKVFDACEVTMGSLCAFCRLVEELKQQNPDFPNVISGIYVHEVVPHSPAQK